MRRLASIRKSGTTWTVGLLGLGTVLQDTDGRRAFARARQLNEAASHDAQQRLLVEWQCLDYQALTRAALMSLVLVTA